MDPTDAPAKPAATPGGPGWFERAATGLLEATNQRPWLKRLQSTWLHSISQNWVRRVVDRRTYVDGIEWLVDLEPDRGVLLTANHRSFFDQYIAMLTLYESGARWPKRLYFPVRAEFFYDHPAGVLLNLAVGGGAMFPPIYRDRSRATRNKEALTVLHDLLARPGTLVGMHPEGTRGKGPDPYELLPAQPGVGEVILRSRPLVVPLFIGGLGNDFVQQARLNFSKDARREDPLILCFGEPVDYEEFAGERPRMTLHKRVADRVRDSIIALGQRERELRAACRAGWIPDDDPGWLLERIKARKGVTPHQRLLATSSR